MRAFHEAAAGSTHPALRWTTVATLVAVSASLAGCLGGGDDDSVANACAVVTDTGAVVVGSGLPGDPAAPEPASGFRLGKTATHAKSYMVATANPLASKAGPAV